MNNNIAKNQEVAPINNWVYLGHTGNDKKVASK
jgi:hypothetical protein